MRNAAGITLLAWLAMIGFDFFLHGGLLAGLYQEASPFLLSPLESFRRIPLGYLSFLLMAGLLAWLMMRMQIKGWRSGLTFGLQMGFAIWGALVLGLSSISTANPVLLVGWWVGQTIELGLGGGVIGSALGGLAMRTIAARVVGFLVLMLVITIAMQSFGLAPQTPASAI